MADASPASHGRRLSCERCSLRHQRVRVIEGPAREAIEERPRADWKRDLEMSSLRRSHRIEGLHSDLV